MNDFLTRIAQLSRGEARVIAPRLPSLFAPPAHDDLASASDTVKATVQPVGKAAVYKQTKQAPIAHMVVEETARPVPPAERSTQQVQPQQTITGYTDKREETAHTVVASQENRSPEQHIAEALSGRKQEYLVVAQTASAESTESRDVAEFTELGHIQSNSPPSEKIQTIDPEDVEFPLNVVVDQKGQSGTMTPQAILQLVPDHNIPYTTPQQAMSKLPGSTETAGQQETTVHVNIGRVEVRAQPAAPVTAPRTVRPREKNNLSLHEYLNRRGGRP